MPIRHDVVGVTIDMTTTNGIDGAKPFVVATGPYTTGSFQVKNVQDSSWSTGVLTMEVSADGLNWVAMPAWVGVATNTITADGLYGPLDLSSIAFMRLRVSTAESGLYVRAWFTGKGDA